MSRNRSGRKTLNNIIKVFSNNDLKYKQIYGKTNKMENWQPKRQKEIGDYVRKINLLT